MAIQWMAMAVQFRQLVCWCCCRSFQQPRGNACQLFNPSWMECCDPSIELAAWVAALVKHDCIIIRDSLLLLSDSLLAKSKRACIIFQHCCKSMRTILKKKASAPALKSTGLTNDADVFQCKCSLVSNIMCARILEKGWWCALVCKNVTCECKRHWNNLQTSQQNISIKHRMFFKCAATSFKTNWNRMQTLLKQKHKYLQIVAVMPACEKNNPEKKSWHVWKNF